ncbi:MAG: hypothetical protein WC010_03620 [Candidatus Absconditabacterales bacterium]
MNKTYSDLSKKVNVMYMENINNLSCFFSTNTYLRTNLLPINKNMIDTDIFIEQMLIKVIPDIDDEGLEMMIEETKPVLYDRVMTHIVGQIDEKDGQGFLDILEEKGVTPEVADYLKTKISNFPEFLDKVYDDFETMYLKEFKSFEKEFPVEEEEKE